MDITYLVSQGAWLLSNGLRLPELMGGCFWILFRDRARKYDDGCIPDRATLFRTRCCPFRFMFLSHPAPIPQYMDTCTILMRRDRSSHSAAAVPAVRSSCEMFDLQKHGWFSDVVPEALPFLRPVLWWNQRVHVKNAPSHTRCTPGDLAFPPVCSLVCAERPLLDGTHRLCAVPISPPLSVRRPAVSKRNASKGIQGLTTTRTCARYSVVRHGWCPFPCCWL